MAVNLSPIGIALLGVSSALLATQRAPHPPVAWRALVYCGLVLETTALVLARNGMANIWLYDLYLPLEFLLVLWITVQGLPERSRVGIGIAAVVLYGTACVYDLSGTGALGRLNAVSLLASAVVLVPLLFMALLRAANTPERSLLGIPYVWLLLALMVYYAGIVPCIAFFNYFLLHNIAATSPVIDVVQVLFVLRSALTAVACWKLRRSPVMPNGGR